MAMGTIFSLIVLTITSEGIDWNIVNMTWNGDDSFIFKEINMLLITNSRFVPIAYIIEHNFNRLHDFNVYINFLLCIFIKHSLL